jgi:4'-phosphopantetheinyl transferase
VRADAWEIAEDVWVTATRLTPGSDVAETSRKAHLLLIELVAEVVPGADDARTGHDAAGAPFIVNRPEIHVSISHDGSWATAAVSRGRPVGIDVQIPVPGSGLRLARRCAGPHASELTAMPPTERDRELAWIWTAQEACVKARRTGLAAHPWSIPIRPHQVRGIYRGLSWTRLDLSPAPISCAFGTEQDCSTGFSGQGRPTVALKKTSATTFNNHLNAANGRHL